MNAQMKKGLLDACVLYTLKNEDTYGYKLTQDISKYLDVSESALYPVLRRLESQGLLETYKSEHDGRLRKYYRITANGITELNEYVKELRQLKKIINMIIGDEKDG
jgi:PadR family transcriptional regulator PadR